MGQIPKVTANTLKRIAGVSGKQYKKVQWHSEQIVVKQLLEPRECIRLVRKIIQDCIGKNDELAVELIDFSTKVNIISFYAFVELPDNFDDAYYIIYTSDLYSSICKAINQEQLKAIKNLVKFMAGVDV